MPRPGQTAERETSRVRNNGKQPNLQAYKALDLPMEDVSKAELTSFIFSP
jgi:hypothetical protein